MERLELPRDAQRLLIQIGLTVEGLVLKQAREIVGGDLRPVREWNAEILQQSLKILLDDGAGRLIAELQETVQTDTGATKQAA